MSRVSLNICIFIFVENIKAIKYSVTSNCHDQWQRWPTRSCLDLVLGPMSFLSRDRQEQGFKCRSHCKQSEKGLVQRLRKSTNFSISHDWKLQLNRIQSSSWKSTMQKPFSRRSWAIYQIWSFVQIHRKILFLLMKYNFSSESVYVAYDISTTTGTFQCSI